MNDAEALSLLKSMVEIQSLSGREENLARYIEQTFGGLGLDARVDEAGNSVVQTGGDSEPHIVMLGHMDTVPGNLPVYEQDGKLYGRGTVDAKGPLAVFLVAAARLHERGEGPRLTVVGCVEEEACDRPMCC